jgi:hypothetical protein
MSRWYVVATLLVLSVSPVRADEPVVYPKGPVPLFFSAVVSRQNKDLISLGKPVVKLVHEERDGKLITHQVPEFIPVTTVKLDGKKVKAFGGDGKPLDAEDLAKRLAKIAPVVVFQMDPANPPDPYYLKILKEGTIVFVTSQEMFGPVPSSTKPK